MKNNSQLKSGFTLIEVTVATSVMIFIGLAVAGLQYIMTQNQVEIFNTSTNIEEANRSLETLARELRTARASEQGSYLLASMSAQEIIFYSDIDYDGKSERVRYFKDGVMFKKGVIEPTGNPVTYPSNTEKVKIITEFLRNDTIPVFTYFNGNKQTTTNPSLVRLVQIYVRLNQRENNAQSDYVLQTDAHIRTLKDNL